MKLQDRDIITLFLAMKERELDVEAFNNILYITKFKLV
jgi:hypothetical protein